jgi:TFIIF-interacting CTD phosphatase-like protein
MTTVTREVPIQECLNGKTREESNLDDEAIEGFVNMTKDIERSQALREVAEERLDEDDLPKATTLLWIDAAEVYSLCGSCYHENRDGAWTGSTQNPNQFELQQKMNERLEQGVPCSFCKSDQIKELKEEIADEVDVEVVIVE